MIKLRISQKRKWADKIFQKQKCVKLLNICVLWSNFSVKTWTRSLRENLITWNKLSFTVYRKRDSNEWKGERKRKSSASFKFALSRDFPYITSFLFFIRAETLRTCIARKKSRDSENPLSGWTLIFASRQEF